MYITKFFLQFWLHMMDGHTKNFGQLGWRFHQASLSISTWLCSFPIIFVCKFLATGEYSIRKERQFRHWIPQRLDCDGVPPLVRVRQLVNKLAEPRLPLLMQVFVHSADCPAPSCRACPAECPIKVSGIKLLLWDVGDLQIFALSLHVGQKYFCFPSSLIFSGRHWQ